MVPIPRLKWGCGGLALLGVVLLLAPTASGTSTPFVATPSYVPYGGTAFVEHTAILASGTGKNTVITAPSFKPVTGDAKLAIESSATATGLYHERAMAGVQDIAFDCTGTCVSGTHYVNITWNVTWHAVTNTTCLSLSAVTNFAQVNVSLKAAILDLSGVPTLAGSGLLSIVNYVQTAAGSYTAGLTGQLYTLSFVASLTAGDSYTLMTWFQAGTYAYASAPVGASCSSYAIVTTGLVAKTPTTLESISVS